MRWNGAHAVKRNNKEKEAAETRFTEAKRIRAGGLRVASSGQEERGGEGPEPDIGTGFMIRRLAKTICL